MTARSNPTTRESVAERDVSMRSTMVMIHDEKGPSVAIMMNLLVFAVIDGQDKSDGESLPVQRRHGTAVARPSLCIIFEGRRCLNQSSRLHTDQ